MSDCGNMKNPLKRSGTARKDRMLPGLKPDYVRVDEKRYADWIVFAREFAASINFYELNGTRTGTWGPFFSQDVSAVLGTMAIQDVDAYRRSIKQRFDYLKEEDHVVHINTAEEHLNDLFSAIFTFGLAVDELYGALPEDVTLRKTMENLVKGNLSTALNRLLGYYKAAKALGYLRKGSFDNWKVFAHEVIHADDLVTGGGLGPMWWRGGAASWNAYYSSIGPDESIFGNASLDLFFSGQYSPNPDYTQAQWVQFRKMNHAANHNLFAGVFDQFLMAAGKLVNEAEKVLLQTLQNRNTHPSHYALFLAFLQLFRSAQTDINTITGRHLDFYYEQVLQLKQKAPVPNSAHVLLELAKPVPDHILANDTLFKAGKDSAGKDVSYALKGETTFNKAKIKSLRSVYLGGSEDTIGPVVNQGRMFAAEVINSADGMGAELTTLNKEWHPIANRVFYEGEVASIPMPKASIGFSVGSHYLFLAEGYRVIQLRLATSSNALLKNKHYEVYLTAEKEWYRVPSSAITVADGSFIGASGACIVITATLQGDAPPIVTYDPKVHGGTLNEARPVMKVLLENTETQAYEYEALRQLEITRMQVNVEVGTPSATDPNGVKQLLVTADGGVIDSSKPFQPFGSQPQADSAFVIGSQEIFCKKNVSMWLHIGWANIPSLSNIKYESGTGTTNGVPSVEARFLSQGVWSNSSTLLPFNSGSKFNSSGIAIPALATTDFKSDYLPYATSSVSGFMRLKLSGDFGFKQYTRDLVLHLIAISKPDGTVGDFGGVEPYTPLIQSLEVSYKANSDVVDLNLDAESAYASKLLSFYHQYPFGDGEQHAFKTKESVHYVFPQFRHTNAVASEVLHSGEFYIGFENLGGGQSVNVLFQVLDGSANPTLTKPEEHIQWSYLSGNKWINFKTQEISDSTFQLVQSGIIKFILPKGINTENSLLPGSLFWIKASVAEKADAICKLITVDAQAAITTFKDNSNAEDFLSSPLPAGKISKLKVPQAAVKKIEQKYSSFNGHPRETRPSFYLRVSERLRHKGRAITIWDYEHLILEAFPVHRVKCLNHTKSKDSDYNEVLPGHVTIITIPDLQNRNDVNPLKPYTSQAILQAIDAYLRKRISCHVKLHVVNPLFEEVQVTLKLKLAKGYDDFTIYSNKLREDITAFLSPWAFSGDAEINFGVTIYKSVIINFIEERPYVDYITDVTMAHYDADGVLIHADNDEITPTTAKSVLVSVPASKHEVTPADEEDAEEQAECEYLEDQTE